MKKIRALIIEDESPARDLLRFMLKDHPEIEVIGECGDGFCCAKEIKEKRPDLIFLDIQMPKLTGFELLEVLDERPQVIFTTAFDQYAASCSARDARYEGNGSRKDERTGGR